MKLNEFLHALSEIRERYVWIEDECGRLRARGTSTAAQVEGLEYSTITALAEVRTGRTYCCVLEWDDAAKALGLSLDDALAITEVEDQDSGHDKALARRLRIVVGVTHE